MDRGYSFNYINNAGMRKQLEALIAAAEDANAAGGNYPVPRTNPALANTVKERIIAGYVSHTWKWDRFSIVAGVRVENTTVTSVGEAAVGTALPPFSRSDKRRVGKECDGT